MDSRSIVKIPSLFVQSEGDQSSKVALMLTGAQQKCIVRMTGGCGNMSAEDAASMQQTLVDAFAGFKGAMLFGGTRMVMRDDHSIVVPGITEVPPLIRSSCPGSIVLGIVPRTQDFQIAPSLGMIVSSESNKDFITIIHPSQDACLVVQHSADKGVLWDAEYQECMRITENLRRYAEWQSLLVCYNGGDVTEKELLATAERRWPVLLIEGSGRTTDRYASDERFLDDHPSVAVTQNDSHSIRQELMRVGALPAERPHLVRIADTA